MENGRPRAIRPAVLGALLGLLALIALPGPARAQQANRPPKVSPISATFRFPTTTYRVQAFDPDGDPLTFAWSKTNERPCGTFTGAGPTATWSHPDAAAGGNCPDEPAHPGTISVRVSDGHFACRAVYPFGSAPGFGPQPGPCKPLAAATPTPTPVPTASPQASPTIQARRTGGSALPLVLAGGGAVAAVALAGGLLLRRRARSKGCAREMLAVARAKEACRRHEGAIRRALTTAQEAWTKYDSAKKTLTDAKDRVAHWKQRVDFLGSLVESGTSAGATEDPELEAELRMTPADVLRNQARTELQRVRAHIDDRLQGAVGDAELAVQRATSEIGTHRATLAKARGELHEAEEALLRCRGIAAGQQALAAVRRNEGEARARPCFPIPTISGGPRDL